jgi:hypothetical protein
LSTARRPPAAASLATRLLLAVGCVYGPFALAPYVAQIAGCSPCRDAWFGAFLVLPGRYPAALLADALGLSPVGLLGPLAVAVVVPWILMTAWCGRECRAVPAYSATLSASFAVVLVLAHVV